MTIRIRPLFPPFNGLSLLPFYLHWLLLIVVIVNLLDHPMLFINIHHYLDLIFAFSLPLPFVLFIFSSTPLSWSFGWGLSEIADGLWGFHSWHWRPS